MSDILGIKETAAVRIEINLNISPNPVNQSSLISYQLPEKGNVILNVYDITGRNVAALLNDMQSKGNYSFNYNADASKPGLYFLRMIINDKTLERRSL